MSYRQSNETKTESRSYTKSPWLSKDREKDEMIDKYIKNFKTISTIYIESLRGNWDCDLWRYVHAVAEIQAQMILQFKNIAWSSMITFEKTPDDTEVYRFLSDQRRQASMGFIDVSIPTNHMNIWKKNAELRAKTTAIASPPKPFSQPIKTTLDEEIERRHSQ